jgi:CheY-like chemotaxis protein
MIIFPTKMEEVTQYPLLLAGLRILIADDDDDSRFYITTVLEGDGATVTTVASSVEALDLLPQWQPDIFICDIAMPGEDGYSLIRKVRALKPDQGGQVLAVALTAYADSEDRLRAMEAGFQIHLAKPIDPGTLVETIANLVATNNHQHRKSS